MEWLSFLKRAGSPLSARKLRFGYDGKDVLRGFSVDVKRSRITTVIGKSGSGKSTFLRLAAGTVTGRYDGSIKVFGRHRGLGQQDIGFVPQERAYLPELSITDNIVICGELLGVAPELAVKRAEKLARELELDVPFTRTPKELSGGQQVRLNIILSLLHDPKLLILDEPFVGLDFRNRRLLWHFLLAQKARRKSVLLTSHLLAETQEHADTIVILKDGRVFYQGSVAGLQKKLGIGYVYEVRSGRLSEEKRERIRQYCATHRMQLLEDHGQHFLFALSNHQQRQGIGALFARLDVSYEEVGFREPTLDEVFLTA